MFDSSFFFVFSRASASSDPHVQRVMLFAGARAWHACYLLLRIQQFGLQLPGQGCLASSAAIGLLPSQCPRSASAPWAGGPVLSALQLFSREPCELGTKYLLFVAAVNILWIFLW